MTHPDIITTSIWDEPGNVELLTKLYTEGKSFAQIAAAIPGSTRNAVIGKAKRMKLKPREDRYAQSRHTSSRARQAGELAHIGNEPHRAGSLPEDDAGVDVTALIGIMDLTAHTCRWPIGDPLEPGFGFCGKEPVEGKPYCEFHSRRAFIAI